LSSNRTTPGCSTPGTGCGSTDPAPTVAFPAGDAPGRCVGCCGLHGLEVQHDRLRWRQNRQCDTHRLGCFPAQLHRARPPRGGRSGDRSRGGEEILDPQTVNPLRSEPVEANWSRETGPAGLELRVAKQRFALVRCDDALYYGGGIGMITTDQSAAVKQTATGLVQLSPPPQEVQVVAANVGQVPFDPSVSEQRSRGPPTTRSARLYLDVGILAA